MLRAICSSLPAFGSLEVDHQSATAHPHLPNQNMTILPGTKVGFGWSRAGPFAPLTEFHTFRGSLKTRWEMVWQNCQLAGKSVWLPPVTTFDVWMPTRTHTRTQNLSIFDVHLIGKFWFQLFNLLCGILNPLMQFCCFSSNALQFLVAFHCLRSYRQCDILEFLFFSNFQEFHWLIFFCFRSKGKFGFSRHLGVL